MWRNFRVARHFDVESGRSTRLVVGRLDAFRAKRYLVSISAPTYPPTIEFIAEAALCVVSDLIIPKHQPFFPSDLPSELAC
jgi:hypothetical protein